MVLGDLRKRGSFLRKANKRWLESKQAYQAQEAKNGDSSIRFYNWWNAPYESLWLYRFVENCGLLDNSTKKLRFCSVFGQREVLDFVSSDIKVFFSGENLHNPHRAKYADAMLCDPGCKLSLGFDCFENERYLRFPLWLTYVFEPSIEKRGITQRCEQLRYPQDLENRQFFAALVARKDVLGVRTKMYESLSSIGKINCPSAILHNDDSLKQQYKDDKLEYLRNHVFNLCPENTNSYGYVTEKVFEAIYAGCIPVYWGSYNNPEPQVLNHDAIVFWDFQDAGQSAVKQVADLYSSPTRWHEFAAQPRLLPSAEEEVEHMMVDLHRRLKELIKYS